LLTPLADDRGGMSVNAPVDAGRDLNQIYFMTAGGVTTLMLRTSTFVRA
jgi:hypothetical protein